jgi:hypothetical protein
MLMASCRRIFHGEHAGLDNIPPLAVFDLEVPDLNLISRLDPVDDLAPVVVETYAGSTRVVFATVRGTASDTGTIAKIEIDGHSARAVRPNFAEWELTIPAAGEELVLRAEDAGGFVSSTKLNWRWG